MKCLIGNPKKYKLTVMIFIVAAFIFGFCLLIGCSDDSSSYDPIFNIYASDVNVTYDGRPHSIIVSNTLDGDIVYYAVGNSDDWSEVSPSFTVPGTYIVRFKVLRPVLNDFAQYISYATIVIERSVLDGISATDAVYIFDGEPHNITVLGTELTDIVTYSSDGYNFTSELSIVDVGEYNIYYRVTGLYGDYADSCMLTVLPKIDGRYLNGKSGVVYLFDDHAIVGDSEYKLVYDISKSGYIGDSAFEISSDVLTFDGNEYSSIAESKFIYKLNCNDNVVYFAADRETTLNISFESDNAVIEIDGKVIAELPDVNYCTTTSSYKNDCIDIEAVDTVTQIDLSFTRLIEQTVGEYVENIVYDGYAHALSIEYEGELMFSEGGEFTDSMPEFIDVGKYSVMVLYLLDGYLPFEARATLFILPNIYGIYYNGDTVLCIDNDSATINGVEFDCIMSDGTWLLNGKEIETKSDGIIVSGITYGKRVSEFLLLMITPTETTVIVHSKSNLFCSAESSTDSIEFRISDDADETIFEYAVNSDKMIVIINVTNRFVVTNNDPMYEVFGVEELANNPLQIFELVV